MASPRNRRHIIVPTAPTVELYTPHGRPFREEIPVPASRVSHGQFLKQSFESAITESKKRRSEVDIQVHQAIPGLYIQFDSQPGVPLKLSSLESARQGIELVAVSHSKPDTPKEERIESATIFVPDGKVDHFLSRFDQYAQSQPKQKGERRHEDMIDRIATLRLATLRALWTDYSLDFPGDDETIWWEVWLRRHDGDEFQRITEFAGVLHLPMGERRLQFDDRIVVLIRATPQQLSTSIDVLNDLAEVRKAKETAAEFVDIDAQEQSDWTKYLCDRTTVKPDVNSFAICILDTGVNHQHPLLECALSEDDCHTCNPAWGKYDHHGHGTEMAGLAIYGDLAPVLSDSAPVEIRHRLESVKVLPPKGANPPELYGSISADAVAQVEIHAYRRSRCFSMAVTATDQRDRGQPTSWSAAIDALSAGRSFDSSKQGLVFLDDDNPLHRLFVLSAGNIEGLLEIGYLERSDTEPVHDPAQAWNALTVGAYTDKNLIKDSSWDGWKPLARSGDLSPWSTTSVTFSNTWPIKPDVVFEGGNVVRNSSDEVDFPVPDLSLLSTYFKPADKSFVISWATSAATAQVARIAARVATEYPELWPETVRGLIVHSANWTKAMNTHLAGASRKRDRAQLVRRYGFGVPSIERAIRSANDSLTLVVQRTIRPFAKGKMLEMHLHELPWPKEALETLGDASVRLRVTLSYFVEPNPARRGWKKRHRYASHGLRFEVKKAAEEIDAFRKRLNQRALDEDEEKPSEGGDSSDWYLGEQARNRGSLHSDIWVGTAADLADRGVIGIYPVSGWWKEQPKRDRSEKGVRYALVASIETDAIDVDIWTPVANEVGVPIEVVS